MPGKTFPYEFPLERDSIFHIKEVVVLSKPGLALLINHENELYHFFGKMLRAAFKVAAFTTVKHPSRPIPGFQTLDVHSEEPSVANIPKKPLQSKSRRQRSRRNIIKRIYGSSYDHGMDDYR